MIYALIENNSVKEYPVFENQIKERFPNVSFSVPFVPPSEYVEVQYTTGPVFDYTKTISEGIPTCVDGKWYQTWQVEDVDQESIDAFIANTAGSIRAQRNSKLSSCDWTQLPDSPVDSHSWAIYRQSLRDITLQAGFPLDIIWPDEP